MFSKKKKLLIIGAGEAGELVCNECVKSKFLNYDVVGFIDDDISKSGSKICGKKVLGGREDIPVVADKYGIEEIIIAIPTATGNQIRGILAYAQIPGVKLKIVPGLYEIINDEISIIVRDVKADDLLGRETVVIDENGVKERIFGKTVLVTGAAGSIGEEIALQAASFSPGLLILLDWNENGLFFLEHKMALKFPNLSCKIVVADIKDSSYIEHIFSSFSPEIVFHAAAFKHVPLMEHSAIPLVKNNLFSLISLMNIAVDSGVEKFIFISTDKAVNPVSLMGASKRCGELLIRFREREGRTKFSAVRFGNVLGTNGSVVSLFKRQIEAGGPVTVTDPDMRRYFMSVKEAVMLVLQASLFSEGGDIFLLDMGEKINILDLARELISLYGYIPDRDIKIKFTGIRAGEKLEEELLWHDEEKIPLPHSKIYRAVSEQKESKKFNFLLRSILKAVERNDDESVGNILMEMALC